MAYIVRWKWGKHKTIPKSQDDYYPCFARLNSAKSRYLTVYFVMHGKADPLNYGEFFDWREDILTGTRFTRIVNYWITLGKKMGFLLDLTWAYDHESGVFSVVLDTKPIRDAIKSDDNYEGFLKLLKMHLFYIRFINEVNSVVWFTIRNRTRLKRKYKHLTDLNVFILAERHKLTVQDEMPPAEFDEEYNDIGKWRVRITDKPTKIGAISLSKYAYYGHELFGSLGPERQIKAGLKPDPIAEFLSIGKRYISFDTDMWPSQERQYMNYALNLECERVNDGIGKEKASRI